MAGAYIGTMGWSYDHWEGNFSPEDTGPAGYLSEYAKHFNSVEVNSTFYRIPRTTTVENWSRQTPDDFLFAVKFPRSLTHGRSLWDEPEKLEVFLGNIARLGAKLGPLLLQFPAKFTAEDQETLGDFIQALPEDHRYAVEFRHRSWFKEETQNMLRDLGVALVQVDHPWMPKAEVVTSEFTYIRWQGDRRNITGDKGRVERDRSQEIKKWTEKIHRLLEESVDIFGYFSKYYSGHPPTDARQLLKVLHLERKKV
jgi:uncharacterized protein YecE (DUF72 family)